MGGNAIVPRTKEEIAYEKLKSLILDGQLPINEFVSQRMLAEMAGTNVTTLRTALRQLENDDLIENVPQWGVRIPIETEETLKDRYYMRELLETGVVRKIREREGLVDAHAIEQKAVLCDTVAQDTANPMIEFSRVHFDFHMELARQSGSPLLVQGLNRIYLKGLIQRHIQRLWKLREFNHSSLADTILHADEESAVAAIRKHVRSGLVHELEALREELRQYP